MSEISFFDQSATAQIVVDPFEGKLLAVNQEACRLLCLSKPSCLEKPVSEIFEHGLPELIVFTQEILDKGHAWTDKLCILVDDEAVQVEISGRYSIQDDHPTMYLSLQIAQEIDALRSQSEAERYYASGLSHWNRITQVFREFETENQLLLDAAGEGIYGVDSRGITNFLNPAAQKILGYTPEELIGKNMHTMVHHSHSDGSHFDMSDCPILETFRDGKVHASADDIFWNKNGLPVDVEYTSTPIIENDFIVGAVVIFRDVSQKKANEKKLLEALEEVQTLKNRVELENAYLQEEINSEFNHHIILGNSPAINKLLQQIRLVAPTESTVLIQGESGTGKELIARSIHEASNRSHRPLIRVNCAAIPGDLFESEFFGHVKGSFTSAVNDRPGRFELADGGTIFLDEVAEIPVHLQGKLLRVLQEQQFERIGDSKTRKVDVRIIAATNKNLQEQVFSGDFREDLYFRLNVFPIKSSPLRERKEDIPLLTQHFLKKASLLLNIPNLKIPLSEMEKLKSYHWPGNIRELENVLERSAILNRGNKLRFDDLSMPAMEDKDQPILNDELIMTDTERDDWHRRNLIMALTHSRGKISGKGGAAELLAVKPTTLTSRIKKFNIDTSEFRNLT